MFDRSAILHLNTPDETSALAKTIAARLGPGDVVLLSGDVGAGKTHFARSVILDLLAIPEDVPSPTYTLVQTYPGPKCDIWHADLYRLTDTNEVDELGLIDAFLQAICLIEWPDRLGDQTPVDALHLHFDVPHGDDRRLLGLCWSNPDWDRKLGDLCHV